jgi:protein disulfide-isomerase
MKKLLLSLLICWVAWQGQAAEAKWLTDFSKAQSKAQADKKMILMEFTGSDWCPPCQALKKKVLTSDEFVSFAKDNLVLVEVDFPKHAKQTEEQKKANRALAEKWDVSGYPTVIVLDSEGTELDKKTGYGGDSAKNFVKNLEELKEKAKAKCCV